MKVINIAPVLLLNICHQSRDATVKVLATQFEATGSNPNWDEIQADAKLWTLDYFNNFAPENVLRARSIRFHN